MTAPIGEVSRRLRDESIVLHVDTVKRLRDAGWTIEPPAPRWYADGVNVFETGTNGWSIKAITANEDNDQVARDIAAFLNEKYP